MSPAEQTAGAPTFTPYPTYTPGIPGLVPGLPTQPPPQQPPPSYYADCKRPQNGFDVAGWVDYERCMTTSYFEFSPRSVSTIAAIPTMFAGQEPFGTLYEIVETQRRVEELVNSYDWEHTGLEGMDDAPNPGVILATASSGSPYNGGKIVLNPRDGSNYSSVCEFELGKIVGKLLATPMCFIFNILRELALMPWFQLFINLACIGALGIYFWKKLIDMGIV